jgi:hypothetical protein
MPDPWEPDPIPASLPHKPYTLPTIGTDPWPGREIQDDLDSFMADLKRDHGQLYVVMQGFRVEAWTETVAAYEADPRRFRLAWEYLDKHPIFYRFVHARDDEPLPDVIQERCLRRDFALYELYFRVSDWCAERCENDECDHPTRDVCWIETGPWTWPAEKPDPDEPRTGNGVHDYRLDVYGDSYESCIVQLAHKVWTLYGNDRALDGTANQFDDEDDEKEPA